jgi:hypothetical protein
VNIKCQFFACYKQNSTEMGTTMQDSSTLSFRGASWEIQDMFPGDSRPTQQIHVLSTSSRVFLIWEVTKSKGQMHRIEETRKVWPMQVFIYTFFNEIPYPNPLLLCYFSFKPASRALCILCTCSTTEPLSHTWLPSFWPIFFTLLRCHWLPLLQKVFFKKKMLLFLPLFFVVVVVF